MSTSSFLVRRQPLNGESLSSFRQRVGWANGFRLFPALDERLRRTDHDRMVVPSERQWLADIHQVEFDVLRRLTLERWMGQLCDGGTQLRLPVWWTCSRYGAGQPTYGPMVCYQCLSEDSEPYFRLQWRLGFVTHCPVHRSELHDRCFDCGCSPWPTGSAVYDRLHKSFAALNRCWHCAVHSSTAPATGTTNGSGHLAILGWLDNSRVTLGAIQVPAVEAFAALRELCQLFWRRRSALTIAGSRSYFASIAEAVQAAPSHCNRVEIMPLSLRSILIPAAYEILRDWPTSFLEFSAVSGITRQHFFDTYGRLPTWMIAVIDAHLAMQNRFITVDDVRHTFQEHLRVRGVTPKKADLIRQLGAGCRKGLSELYRLREEATEAEALAFYQRYCLLRSKAIKHSQRRNPFVFNTAAIAAQLLGVLDQSATGLSPTELNRRLTSSPTKVTIGRCSDLVARVQRDLHEACVATPEWAHSHRGSKREVRDCFRSLFAGLPRELACSPSVFSRSPAA